MNDDIETIKQNVLQQIKPINFGDELNIAAILGEDEQLVGDILADNLSDNPSSVTAVEETAPILKSKPKITICHICSKIFANIRNFKKHFTKHTSRYSCPTCKRTFARKATKLKHVLQCENETVDGIVRIKKRKRKTSKNKESFKYHCEECDKNFTRRENYDQHIMVHNGVQVICDFCQKKLSSFKSFQRHKKIHENPLQKLACEDCPSKFSLKSNLQRHIKNHQHKNEIICNKCNANLKTEYILQKHQSQNVVNTCSLCTQLFCLEQDFRSHLKKDHPDLWFKCNQCTSTPFMTRAVQHLKVHAKKLHSVQLDSSKCFQEGWFILLSN